MEMRFKIRRHSQAGPKKKKGEKRKRKKNVGVFLFLKENSSVQYCDFIVPDNITK